METLVPYKDQNPVPSYVKAEKSRSTLGSLLLSVFIGALVAVCFLYLWGADLAKYEASAQSTKEAF